MANMANIVVKKANGTTDVTYTALTASAGDTVPARWRENSQASVVGFRPTLTQVARANGNNNARVVTTRFKYSVVRAVGGVDTVVGVIPLELSATVGTNFTEAEIDEAIAQGVNLFASTLIRQGMREGFAPV